MPHGPLWICVQMSVQVFESILHELKWISLEVSQYVTLCFGEGVKGVKKKEVKLLSQLCNEKAVILLLHTACQEL